MTEPELLAEIIKLCDSVDPPVRWVHLRAVRMERCPWVPGLPDLLLAGSRKCAWRELKCGSTRVTAVQAGWLDALEQAGQDVAVWTPLDLADGTIAVEIAALNGLDVPRQPWIPPGATEADIAHRHALYG